MAKIQSSQGPFSFIYPSVRQVSIFYYVAFALFCVLLWITQSYNSLLLILVSIVASTLTEFLYNKYSGKNTLKDGTCIVEGFMIGLLLPASYPPITVFIVICIVQFIVKHLFGGLANCWANPMIISLVILFTLGSSHFSGFLLDMQATGAQEVGSQLFSLGIIEYLPFDLQLTSVLNNVFSSVGIRFPEGYITLFCDSQSSIPAFRFNLLTLIISIFFVSERIVSWVIPFVSVLTYSVLVRFFSLTPFTGIIGQGDILLALLTGGTLFFVFFMFTWYGTIPYSFWGKCIYAFIAGIMLFIFNGYGTSSIGAVFSALAANIVSPFIQLLERRYHSFIVLHNSKGVINE